LGILYPLDLKLRILDLKPTQFALGLREVARKVEELKAMGHDARHEYLHARPVPVVLSAKKHWHLVDHHHHARACWEIGVEELPVEVKADLSHLEPPEFWSAMHESRWVHLLDQFGKGPHEARLLPEDIRGLADDPYRSLAWALRHAGAYQKSDQAFSEFKWADFLRQELVVEPCDAGFKHAIDAALAVARSPKAAHLPGYLGRKP
jgi:hypothetical protein